MDNLLRKPLRGWSGMDAEKLKNAGLGGSAAIIVALLLQGAYRDQPSITEAQIYKIEAVAAKNEIQEKRIDALEVKLDTIDNKMDNGFAEMRDALKEEIGEIRTLLTVQRKESWAKRDHNLFSDAMESRIRTLELAIEGLKSRE